MKFTDNRGHGNKNFVIPGNAHRKGKTDEEVFLEHQKALEEQAEFIRKEELRLHGMDAKKARSVDSLRMSFIKDDEEEAEAAKIVEDLLGFPRPRPVGYMLSVKVYVRDEDVGKLLDKNGKETLFYAPPRVSAHDKFKNCSALVIARGIDTYKDKNRYPSGPWCRVGDWVLIARNGGPQVNYRGVPVTYIPEDNIYDILECPTHVTRD